MKAKNSVVLYEMAMVLQFPERQTSGNRERREEKRTGRRRKRKKEKEERQTMVKETKQGKRNRQKREGRGTNMITEKQRDRWYGGGVFEVLKSIFFP